MDRDAAEQIEREAKKEKGWPNGSHPPQRKRHQQAMFADL